MRSEQIFMKKSFLRQILVSSLFFMLAGGSTYADENLPLSTKRIQRSFLNMDLQKPVVNAAYVLLDADSALINTTYYIPGWRTTHKQYNSKKYPMEFWKGGGPDNIATNPNSNFSNNQYVELNAEEASNIYQSICLLPDDKISGSFDHATRLSATEKAEFFISKIVDRTISNEKLHITDSKDHADMKTWNTTTFDSITVAGTVSKADKYEFVFQAKKWSKDSITYGNFIDNVNIKLRPAIEFSAASGNIFENEVETVHSINFNIVGNVKSDLKVSFIIDNDSVSNAAKWEKDYELYSRSFVNNAEVLTLIKPVKIGNNYTFNYTVKYDNSLDYDAGVQVKGLVVKIKNNNLLDGDRVIPFGLEQVESASTVVLSTGDICGNTPISTFEYTIKDDDTDLIISKTLNTEKIPVSNGLVSYDLVLENKGLGAAKDVILKDTLLANLTKTDSTQLICTAIENGGKTATCPALTAKSVEQLFSKEGLTLSSIVGLAKFKFSLSGLKVSANDTSAGKYLGKIVNKAEVLTSSNDIDLTNNNAIAENLIVASSDLSNNKSGAVQSETGTGLFYIAQGGRKGTTPLIEKIADTLGRVYFPLNIQNSSVYAQNYKLYASSTAIEPDSEADYSALKGSSISSFVNGLKIKFYPVIDSECKAGLSNSDISQMNVPASSTAQVCVEITGTSAEATNIPVWFAIESLETGLGDIIKNSIAYSGLATRNLVLVNDQQAQVQIGGTYVFAHRLTNSGSMTESDIQIALNPLTPKDGFAYTLFIDKNSNGVLDSDDVQVKLTDALPKLKLGEHLALLIKVQAPSTATTGMKSQVELKVTPLETVNKLSLLPLINLDTITVGINQISLQKMQFKQAQCLNMLRDQVIKAPYQISSQSIGNNDCIVYRIMVTNIGAETITSIDINDMYPAYTTPWSSNQVLPMTDSNETVTEKNQQIKTLIKELKPNENKSLYFGIKLQ